MPHPLRIKRLDIPCRLKLEDKNSRTIKRRLGPAQTI